MEQIKPIDTVYNGYRFRSRLEARWAVFFDAAGIEYEYEPEGFNLSGGVKYLPDFYLPNFCVYVEIKPHLRVAGEDWKRIYAEQDALCRNFRTSTGKAICLFHGYPWDDHWNTLFAWDTTDSGGGESEFDIRIVNFPFFPEHPHPIIAANDWRRDREIYLDSDWSIPGTSVRVHNAISLAGTYPNECGGWVLSDLMTEFYDPKKKDRFTLALLKARQARFEHGETP